MANAKIIVNYYGNSELAYENTTRPRMKLNL